MLKRVLFEKNGNKLIAKVVTEGAMQRIAVMVYQENKAGEKSVPNIFQRSELLKKSKVLQELLNLSVCLTEEELEEVIEKANAMLAEPDKVAEAENIGTQATPSQLYKAICEHGKEAVSHPVIPQTEEEPKQMIWIDGNYLNIRTSDLNDFLKEVPEADEYKRSDILRSLKLLGVLDTDSGRAYDKKVSKYNKKINCYRIQMPAEKSKKPKTEETQAVETKSVQEPAPAKAKPSSEKEKLLAGTKELMAKNAEIKIKPTVTKNAETLTEEDYGGCYFD